MFYCRALKFEERPDYAFLKKLFHNRLEKEHLEYDFLFDWNLIENKKTEPNSGKFHSKSKSIKYN